MQHVQAGRAANGPSGGVVAPLCSELEKWRVAEDGKRSREHLNVNSDGSSSICRVGAT